MTKPSYDLPGAGAGTFTSIGIPAVGCATVRDFVFILPTDDRYSVRWGAIGDPTSFPTPDTDAARTAQAGLQTFPNRFGFVTGVAGNDFFAYIFQERAIWKATYVSGDIVFTFDAFEEGIGCWRLNRFTRVDDRVFFESEYGYHSLENDVVTDIGRGRVNKTYTPTSNA